MLFNEQQCFCKGDCRANAAIALNAQGDHELAFREARRAVLNAPNCPHTHGILGWIMTHRGAAVYGENHLRLKKTLGAPPAMSEVDLGANFIAQGRLGKAKAAYFDALKANPNYLPASVGLAKVAEREGDFEAAKTLCEQIFAMNSDVPELRQVYAKALAATDDYGAAIAMLSVNADPHTLFDRGKIHEKFGDFDLAWADYTAANQQSGKVYKDAEAQLRIANHRSFTGVHMLERLPVLKMPVGSPVTPIFITGYPRSGTTLLEQILSAHPKITAGDELPYLLDIAGMSQAWLGSEQPYPFALEELALGDRFATLRSFRAYYNSKVMDIADPERPYITDKMPLNEMHIPLMSLAFGEAPIFYLRRHPLDIIVSNYSTYLTHGFNQSFNLISCATHYSRVDALIEHYKAKVRMNLTEIRYENLVDNLDAEARRLIETLGLPFDDRCLKPELNGNSPRTPSYGAVKQPVHSKAVARWKKFEKFLGPAQAIVGHIIEREGY